MLIIHQSFPSSHMNAHSSIVLHVVHILPFIKIIFLLKLCACAFFL